jgi:hypothetical protein
MALAVCRAGRQLPWFLREAAEVVPACDTATDSTLARQAQEVTAATQGSGAGPGGFEPVTR